MSVNRGNKWLQTGVLLLISSTIASSLAILQQTVLVCLSLEQLSMKISPDIFFKMFMHDQMNIIVFRIFYVVTHGVAVVFKLIIRLGFNIGLNDTFSCGIISFVTLMILVYILNFTPLIAMQSLFGISILGICSCVGGFFIQKYGDRISLSQR